MTDGDVGSFRCRRGRSELEEWKRREEGEDESTRNQMERERKLLVKSIDERLRADFIGQEGALKTVASHLRRKAYGFTQDSPMVFLFLGTSGIGKTECAKRMAKCLTEKGGHQFIRVDMSEYQARHEVAKLIGSPPGYVGYDKGGYLTEQLKAHPNAVVLFDEIEKAHKDILNIFLQLFDEGRLTDGKGRTVNGKDAIYVMTSNLASEEIADEVEKNRKEIKAEVLRKTDNLRKSLDKIKLDENELAKIGDTPISENFKANTVKPILQKHFKRNEFLGRINEIVYFVPFSQSEMRELAQRQLQIWKKKFQDTQNAQMTWSHGVETHFADAYDISYGARSITHAVEHEVVNLIANAFDNDSFGDGSQLKLIMKPLSSTDREEEVQLLIKKNGTPNFVLFMNNKT